MKRPLFALSAALAAAFAPAALAQMSCAELGVHLQAQPHVFPVNSTTPLTSLTTTGSARCEANFIYSSRGGTADGYAEGQDQRIVIRRPAAQRA